MDGVSSPQPLVVGEAIKNTQETIFNTKQNQTYATQLTKSNSATSSSKIELVPVSIVHGEPTVQFTMEEVNAFTIEEGLHQAIILKFSYGKPDIHDLKQIIPKQFDVKGNCNVGQLEFRHILVRFDLFDDYVQALSRPTGYVKDKGDEFFFRTFQWTIGFNPREETSRAVVWISLPDLPANFFAKRSLMSIASAVGKPLAVDKATQDRTRPSTARVKVLLDLLDKHPKRVRIHILDMKSGKVIEHYQQIFYDNLPKFCTCCRHQGHDERTCRWNTVENKEDVAVGEVEGLDNLGKLQGDARDYLNARRTGQLGAELEKENLFEQQQVTQNGEGNQIGNQKNDKESNHVAMENTVRDVSMLDKGPRTIMGSTVATVQKGVNHAQIDAQLTHPDGGVSTITKKSDEIMEQKVVKVAGLLCRVSEQQEESMSQVGHVIEKDNTSAGQKFNTGVGSTVAHKGDVDNAGNNLTDDAVQIVPAKGCDHAIVSAKGVDNGSVQKENTHGNDVHESTKSGKFLSHKAVGAIGRNGRMPIMKAGNASTIGLLEQIKEKHVGHVGILTNQRNETNKMSNGQFLLENGQKFAHGKESTLHFGVGSTNHMLGEHPIPFVDFPTTKMLVGNIKKANNAAGNEQQHTHDSQRCDGKKFDEEAVHFDTIGTPLGVQCVNNVHGNLGDVVKGVFFPSKLHFSSPRVEKIINDTQVAMMLNSNPMIKQPMVTLNTSVQEIPSQSVESIGEHSSGSGHQLLSTGNDKEVSKDRSHKSWADRVENWENGADDELISDNDRALLDTLGSPKPHRSAYSTGSKTTAQKMKASVAKRHEPRSEKKLKRHDPLWMVLQDEINQKLETNLRIASSHEEKEDELIESRAGEVNPTGDLSPKNSEKTKVAQEIRQLPMRAAKQKGIASSTSMRSNKSDKK